MRSPALTRREGRTVCQKTRATPFFEPLECRQLLSGGELDLTYGVNGIAQLTPAHAMHAADVAVQPDGKTVVAGRHLWRANGNTYTMFAVARFNVDGPID